MSEKDRLKQLNKKRKVAKDMTPRSHRENIVAIIVTHLSLREDTPDFFVSNIELVQHILATKTAKMKKKMPTSDIKY